MSDAYRALPRAAGTADLCHAERWRQRSVPEDQPAPAGAGLTGRGGAAMTGITEREPGARLGPARGAPIVAQRRRPQEEQIFTGSPPGTGRGARA
ncbi:hypothetical protein NDU88_000399 [Pleurodeles waltl]|uniref:Uncharacterized protein n=1 Tax=Pleurodeles waltl TaxID=8319 RepID=A0AAV7TFD7_PLEWA|nr:hypothetical protein NDU88_000399 [Pleurodeles waltl]